MGTTVVRQNQRAKRSIADWTLYVIPILYLAVVLWLQPADHLGKPGNSPLPRLFYDDFDWTAVGLRSLNAELGRVPGKMTDPCTIPDAWIIDPPDGGTAPVPHQYFLEYPDTALSLFRIPYHFLLDGNERKIGPGILDVCQAAIVLHLPETATERALWRN